MMASDVVVLGASAGGVEALSRVVAGLPAGFPAAVAVVLHIPPSAPSVLPRILERAGALPAVHPDDEAPLTPGQIYVAPTDRHLIVEEGRLRVTRGPRENGHRPSIDALFRSAARAYGPRVTGAVLTGADDDGTEGLLMIKAYGGVALAQDPAEALFSRMPRSAIRAVRLDGVLSLDELARELIRRARDAGDAGNGGHSRAGGTTVTIEPNPEQELARLDGEVDAWERGATTGSASGYSCPLCGGGIWQAQEGPLLRFRCHTGHIYSPESFANGQGEVLEATLWQALRLLAERAALLRQLANGSAGAATTERYTEQAEELERGTGLLREMLQRSGPAIPAHD